MRTSSGERVGRSQIGRKDPMEVVECLSETIEDRMFSGVYQGPGRRR